MIIFYYLLPTSLVDGGESGRKMSEQIVIWSIGALWGLESPMILVAGRFFRSIPFMIRFV